MCTPSCFGEKKKIMLIKSRYNVPTNYKKKCMNIYIYIESREALLESNHHFQDQTNHTK